MQNIDTVVPDSQTHRRSDPLYRDIVARIPKDTSENIIIGGRHCDRACVTDTR